MSRTGRRPGAPRTRDAILSMARRQFALRGYDATSLRGIAGEASVDPALLIHYFGSKERLFVTAMRLPRQLPEVFEQLPSASVRDAVTALLRAYLDLIDSDQSRNAVVALVRSAVSSDKAAAMLREFFSAALLPHVSRLSGQPDASLRASLVASQLVGLAATRHVVRLPPLASAKADDIVRLVAPAIETCLTSGV